MPRRHPQGFGSTPFPYNNMTSQPCPLNTYWVNEGTFLAGEYPRDIDLEKSLPKLQSLIEAGVTFFVDLTEEGELSPYDQLLPEVTQNTQLPVEYQRCPIQDVSIPEEAGNMNITTIVFWGGAK